MDAYTRLNASLGTK